MSDAPQPDSPWHTDVASWQGDATLHSWSIGEALPSHNESCMVCGKHSATSPLLTPFTVLEDWSVGARVRFDERHQGAPLYSHGGMVAALLDDACGYQSFLTARIFVTRRFELDYLRPVVLGTEYDVVARCLRIEGRKVFLRAELLDGDEVVASADGIFITVDLEHFRP